MIDVSTYLDKLESLKTYMWAWIRSHHTTERDWYPVLPCKINMEPEPPEIRYFTFNEWYETCADKTYNR
jgi:hypothetical protein